MKVDTKANQCREEGKQRYVWQDSQFSRRSDGKRPADCDGFSTEDDFTAKLFLTLNALPIKVRREAADGLSERLDYLQANPEAYQDILRHARTRIEGGHSTPFSAPRRRDRTPAPRPTYLFTPSKSL